MLAATNAGLADYAALLISDASALAAETSGTSEFQQNLVDASGTTVDALLGAITDRYLSIDCAVFTPNPSRLDHVRRMVKAYRADGVIHYSLLFCSPYQIEAGPVEHELESEGVPVLRVETDYSTEDVEQIRTRVEAFVERICG